MVVGAGISVEWSETPAEVAGEASFAGGRSDSHVENRFMPADLRCQDQYEARALGKSPGAEG